MGEPQFHEGYEKKSTKQNIAVEVGKFAAKKAVLGYLKVPLLIAAGFLLLVGLIFGLFLSFTASFQEEQEVVMGEGGWEVGNITTFGAKDIPAEFIPIYKEAAEKYGVPWNLLAAHHRVETRFSTISPMISPVGAIGHMQFMPCTFLGWNYPACGGLGGANIPDSILTSPKMIKKYGGYGTDGNSDGRADPMDLTDAVHSAARYLAANGAADGNLQKAVFAYNHSTEYVNDVLGFANSYVSGYTAVETGAGAGSGPIKAAGGMKGVMKMSDAWSKRKTLYVWGGGRTQAQIDKGWFDCSGFIYAMLHANGIKWPTGNTDTLISQGKKVSPNDLQVGDLVFFDSYKKNGHVGFYAGNGKFIGSQSSTGVAYASMTSGYWGKRYKGVIRRVN